MPRLSTPCSPWPHRWRPWRPSCSPSAHRLAHKPSPLSSSPLPLRPRALFHVRLRRRSRAERRASRHRRRGHGHRKRNLWAMGRVPRRHPPRSIGMARAGFRGSAAVIVLLVSAMDGWCPLPRRGASRFCPAYASISRGRQKPPAPKSASQPPIASQPSSAPLAGLGRTGLAHPRRVLHREHRGHDERRAGGRHPLQAILLFSALMMAVVAAMAISGPRRISLFFLYRWMRHPGHRICGRHPVGQAGALVAVAASLEAVSPSA